jgi:hypothetical protein
MRMWTHEDVDTQYLWTSLDLGTVLQAMDEDMDSHAQSMDIPRLGTVDSGKDEDVDRDEG